MAEIRLTRGCVAKVDDADLHLVHGYKWHAFGAGRKKRAATCVWDGTTKTRKTIFMHNLVLVVPKGLVVDHVSGDGMDNRRVNLRPATPKQNARNRSHSAQSGFLGVRRSGSKWSAIIFPNGIAIALGTYPTKEEAAAAYNAAARVMFGEFARCNQVLNVEGAIEKVIAAKRAAIKRLHIEIDYLTGAVDAI